MSVHANHQDPNSKSSSLLYNTMAAMISATDPPIPPATLVAAPLKGVTMGDPVGLAAAVEEPVPVPAADLVGWAAAFEETVPEEGLLGTAVKDGMLEGVEVTIERVIMVGAAVVRLVGHGE